MRAGRVVAGTAVVALAGTVLAMGPVVAWDVVRHGTTTVWDHREFPTRALSPSDAPSPWSVAPDADVLPALDDVDLESALLDADTLALVVVRDGRIETEWYGPAGGPEVTSMVFSVSKSIIALLVGAAVDDGRIEAVTDPVTRYVPELADRGFDDVTIEDLLRMDSSMAYVENDNPFGLHIPFNYTRDLRSMVLGLEVRDEPDPTFRYKSGDNALLSLVLERTLDGATLTDHLHDRLWGPLGAETAGSWIVDRPDGFERSWCCLAMTARDLARFGELVRRGGDWDGEQLVSSAWLDASFEPGFTADRWPDDLADSPLDNYGYQWWLLDEGERLALGKDGQYLFVDPVRDVVIVRLGEQQGDVAWTAVLRALARS